MEEMKHDMTGAATVLGAMILAARWEVPNRVIGIMAFAENMPDGEATVPGAVIRARNGKTVEINNTDAEGRLVLADVLDLRAATSSRTRSSTSRPSPARWREPLAT